MLGKAGIMIFGYKNNGIVFRNSPSADGREGGYFSYKVAWVAAIWLTALITCMAFMGQYVNQPGSAGMPPAQWPQASRIVLDSQHPTLLMFAHPHCPCTRASISELEQVVSDCQGMVNAQVWFIKPTGTAADWTDTDLWRSAAAILGVTVHVDADGTEARRFQSGTSGQTMLYAPSGELLFHGGITVERGHAGDNAGVDAIESRLQHKDATSIVASTPVFGCELFGSCTRQAPLQNTNQSKSGGTAWKQ